MDRLLRNSQGQVLRDEALDFVPFVVHDAADAEVQVGRVELEQLSQQLLELGERAASYGTSAWGLARRGQRGLR